MLLNDQPALPGKAATVTAIIDDASMSEYASMIIAVRKQLAFELPPAFLYDPVFDVLLSLCACAAQNRSLSDNDLCSCSSAAPNSTRRWLRALQDMNLVHQAAGRYRLTADGRDLLRRTFACGENRGIGGCQNKRTPQ